ncbi:hypothetical protein J2X97_001469 [Epilithonimonas hungarica]|nr:hypothetical protein [Epilithonimonas hungarica]
MHYTNALKLGYNIYAKEYVVILNFKPQSLRAVNYKQLYS